MSCSPPPPSPPGGPGRPSPGELACLRLKARGLTDRGVGLALGLATSTVKNHLISLRQRWGVASTAEAVYVGCRNGYLA